MGLDDFRPSAVEEHEETDVMRVFFSTHTDRDEAGRALHACFAGRLYMKNVDVPDEDWAARSQAELRAIRIGRVIVAPPWDVPDELVRRAGPSINGAGLHPRVGPSGPLGPADIVTVIIQPSMGFGTGHHASTRLSLLALQSLNLDGLRALDLGTGSGVLAIAAVRLGAGRATGVDIDPDALASAAENVELNQVGDRVDLREADVRDLQMTAPVVLANLTGAVLERFGDDIAKLVEPGGYLIAGGFTDTETSVLPALDKRLSLLRVEQEAEWVCGILKRG